MNMITMLFVVLSLCVNSGGMLSEENMQNKITSKTVNRISYGVIFNYYQDIVMTSEVWSHVFIIKLPQKVFAEEQNFLETLHIGDAPAKALCMKHNGDSSFYTERQGLSSCKRFESHVKFLIQTATKSYENLHSLIDDIYSLLPQSTKPSTEGVSRQSRALVPFLGTFLSSLTGLALESDLEKLKENIVQINDFVNKETNASRKFVSDTTLLVKLTNDRVDSLIGEVNNRSLTTVKLIEKIDKDNTHLIDFYANLTLHKFQFLTAISDLTNHYTNFLNAIETLSKGKLPSYLFTEKILNDMLNIAHESVNKEFGRTMDIVHKNIQYYYSSSSFICARYRDNLYIKLNIPLANSPDEFRVYRIKTYPIPLHQNEYSHATKIEKVPDNIAISVTKGMYFEIPNSDWIKFTMNPDTQIHRVFHSIDPYDCILAIFFDDKSSIKARCSFSILLQSIQPNVEKLFADTFLLTNISAFTLQCGDKQIQSSCSVCILDIYERCSFQAGNIIIPKLSNSNTSILSNSKPQYIVNLAVLINLFDQSQIDQITGDSKFFRQPDIAIPSYSFYADAMSHNFVENEDLEINLQKASDAVKNDEQIIQNLGQAIIMGKVDIDTNFFFTAPGILLQFVSIFLFLVILNNLYLTYKLKQTLLMLTILQARIAKTDCLDQLVLDFYKNSPAKQTTSWKTALVSVANAENAVNVVTCIATFLIMLLIMIFLCNRIAAHCRRRSRSFHTKFFLLFQSNTHSELIPLMKLLVSINDIDHSITNQIQNIRVHNYLQPVLLFNWDLKFVNKLTNQTYPLPLQLSLTWIQARTLRQILQNQFTVQLLHETNIHF